MSLDRLINLAKRTGDRLIVHDPLRGRDVVILDIGSYEELLDCGSAWMVEDEEPVPAFDAPDTDDMIDAGAREEDETWGKGQESGVSLVETMWGESKEEAAEPLHDAAAERKEEDEPVFYEEPVG